MSFQGKTFAVGNFDTTLRSLYTVPNGTTAYVKFFHIHNSGVPEDTIMLYAAKSGLGDFVIGRCTLLTHEAADVIDKDNSLTLMEGDAIKGQSIGSATGICYFISGGLES